MGRERSYPKTYVTQYIDRFYRPMLSLPPSVPPPDTAANLHRFVRIPKCVRNFPARAHLRRMVHRQRNKGGLEVERGSWLWSLETRPAELGPFYKASEKSKDTRVCMSLPHTSTFALLITLVHIHKGDEPSVCAERPRF